MPWLGRPLSRKLIAEIEASIARYYRQRGFPFVSLSTPPQNIGNGVLQIRVLEFMDGKVSVQGAADASTAHLRSLIRQQPGAPIDTYQLTADLDWLNRYPSAKRRRYLRLRPALGVLIWISRLPKPNHGEPSSVMPTPARKPPGWIAILPGRWWAAY
jgi:hypothetical protein